ncbi:hypothetical protein D3C75_1211830 [compost metagenome]
MAGHHLALVEPGHGLENAIPLLGADNNHAGSRFKQSNPVLKNTEHRVAAVS